MPKTATLARDATIFAPRSVAADAVTGDLYVSSLPLYGSTGAISVIHPDGSYALVTGGTPMQFEPHPTFILATKPMSPSDIGAPALLARVMDGARMGGGMAVVGGDLLVPGNQVVRVRANDTAIEWIAGRFGPQERYGQVLTPDQCDGNGGPATAAKFGRRNDDDFQAEWGVGGNAAGDVYVSISACRSVRKVLANGTVVQFAGRQSLGDWVGLCSGSILFLDNYSERHVWCGDGGPATNAQLVGPGELAVLADGSVVFTDRVTVRRVSPSGTITSLVGNGDYALPASNFTTITGLAADAVSGTIYFSDMERNNVYVVTRTGTGPTGYSAPFPVAGVSVSGHTGDGGPATAAALAGPISLSLFADVLYIAEFYGDCVRAVNVTSGIIDTVVGSAPPPRGAAPRRGEHVSARSLTFALGPGFLDVVAVPSFVDRLDFRSWDVTPVAGTGLSVMDGNGGPATAASIAGVVPGFCATCKQIFIMGTPKLDYWVAPSGDAYIAESISCVIRKVDARTGAIRVVAGSGPPASGRVGTFRTPPPGALPTLAQGGAPATSATFCPASLAGGARGGGLLFFSYGGLYLEANQFAAPLFIGAYDPAAGRVFHVACTASARWNANNGNYPTVFGYAGDGGPALDALCNGPHVGAVDAAGNVYFVDRGNRVARVVRASNGTMATVAGTTVASAGAGEGGPATATWFAAPLFVRLHEDALLGAQPPALGGGVSLYILDYGITMSRGSFGSYTVGFPVVRVVSPLGNVTTVGGPGCATPMTPGDCADGIRAGYMSTGPATAAWLGSPTAMQVDSWGNVYLNDHYTGSLRAIVLGTAIACPVGYACACGTPVPCTDAATYCPGNTLAPLPVADGFFSTPEGSGVLRSGQSRCPPGAYCAGGVRTLSLPGTFGVVAGRTTPRDSQACPPGTYGASAGQVGAVACVPCPIGTYADAPGAALCVPCAAGAVTLGPGSDSNASCVPCGVGGGAGARPGDGGVGCYALDRGFYLESASVADFGTGNAPPAPSSNAENTRFIEIVASVSIVVAVALPLSGYWLYRHCTAPRGDLAKRRASAWSRTLHSSLRTVDCFSLRHAVVDGASPVKRRTAFGGTLSVLAVAVITALSVDLIVQFVTGNLLEQRALLPVTLALSASLGGVQPAAIDAAAAAVSPLPFSVPVGVGFAVHVAGAECAAPRNWTATAITLDAFVLTTASDGATGASVHTLTCGACAFTKLSALTLTFAPSCQSVTLHAAAVSSEGVLTISSTTQLGPAQRLGVGDAVLASIDVTATPALEIFTGADKRSKRGYHVSIDTVVPTRAVSPPDMTLTIALAPAPYYTSIALVPIESPTQLASSLAGLLGLMGAFALVFAVLEQLPAAADAALEAYRTAVMAAQAEVHSMRRELAAVHAELRAAAVRDRDRDRAAFYPRPCDGGVGIGVAE